MFWRKKKPKETDRKQVLQQANRIAEQKRVEVGEEALHQIKEAILRKEKSALDGAKQTILKADQDKVRDNLNLWLRE